MRLAVDFHVHVYPEFDHIRMLRSIERRVQAARCDAAVLFLTERSDCDWFRAQTEHDSSFFLLSAGKIPCLCFAGYQVNSSEGIEVQALATTDRPPEGVPLPDLIRFILDRGGQPMLGWGAGKWLGKRGAEITSILEGDLGPLVLLGDSRHRCIGWPTPAQFRGRKVFNGSDPLNLSGEESAPLSFGHILDMPIGALDAVTAQSILSHPPSATLGGRLDPIRFAMLQTRLRI